MSDYEEDWAELVRENTRQRIEIARLLNENAELRHDLERALENHSKDLTRDK
jgi:hypothetical protein